jgi:IS605 OrfB family transposase
MRTIMRSYRIRSYPNGAQRRLRDRWFGAYRWLWNTALEIRTEAYRQCGLNLTGNDISRWLTQWRGRYFVSFCAEVEKAPPPLSCWAPAVGVDLGLHRLATLSTGEKIENPRHLQARLRYLRQQQRCLSRRQQGSRRRERQKLRVARAHAKVRQARQYALHDLTSRLTQDYDLIFIEDLNVKALSRGRNARSIRDASFGEIRRQLTYKSEWRDKILIVVDRWYASSKTCSNCRHVLDELRLDVRYWTCPKCKACHDRDINAARNLLMEGLRQLAARDERDLRVDAGDTCPEEILVQVLAEEARSGQRNRACLEQASLH